MLFFTTHFALKKFDEWGRILKTAFFQKLFFFAAAFFCLQSFSCARNSEFRENKNLPKKDLTINLSSGASVFLRAEIASTEETRASGYMFRKNIPDGTGMLFVYDDDQPLRFWMKNTPTPLSIAFIDRKGQIKDIFDMKPYNLNGVSSGGFVRYALEVPQGWFSRAGVSCGDFLELDFLD